MSRSKTDIDSDIEFLRKAEPALAAADKSALKAMVKAARENIEEGKPPQPPEEMSTFRAMLVGLKNAVVGTVPNVLLAGGLGYGVYYAGGKYGGDDVKRILGYTPSEKTVQEAMAHPDNKTKPEKEIRDKLTEQLTPEQKAKDQGILFATLSGIVGGGISLATNMFNLGKIKQAHDINGHTEMGIQKLLMNRERIEAMMASQGDGRSVGNFPSPRTPRGEDLGNDGLSMFS
jgi:hypothetical protein